MLQTAEYTQPKKKDSCCIIFLIFCLLILAVIVIGTAKFSGTIEKIVSYITKQQTTSNGNVTLSNQVSIPGTIYFVQNKNLWKLSGSTIMQITHNGSVDEASVSADGKSAITTQLDNNFGNINLIDLTSGSVKALTKQINNNDLYQKIWYVDPTFSFDGTKIAFISDKGKFVSGVSDLSVFEMKNQLISSATQLTHGYPYTGGDADPTYYPLDSNYIVYTKYIYALNQPQPYAQLYILDSKNKQSFALTPDFSGSLQPSFSPDGTYLTFTQRESNDLVTNSHIDVYMMPFNLSNFDMKDPQSAFLQDYQSKILVHQGIDAMPVFSPDGKHIAFIDQSNADFNIATEDLITVTKQGSTTIVPKNFKLITTKSGITSISRLSWVE